MYQKVDDNKKKKLSLFSSGFLNFIYIYAPIIINLFIKNEKDR